MRYRPRRRRRHRRGMGDTSAGDRGMGLGLSRKSRRRRRSIGGRIRRTGCARVPRFINSRWRNLTQCISSPLLHGRSRNPGPPPPPLPPPPPCSADSWNFSWHNDFRRNTSSPSPSPLPPVPLRTLWKLRGDRQRANKAGKLFSTCARACSTQREFHILSYEPKNFAIGFSTRAIPPIEYFAMPPPFETGILEIIKI